MNYEYQNFKILEVSGVDTIKFLQGLTTADLKLLSEDNNITMTAFANLKGRIMSICFVKFISDEKLQLSVEESVYDELLTWLKKYGMFSKVAFAVNDEYSLYFSDEGFVNHKFDENNEISYIAEDGFLNHNILEDDSMDVNATLQDVQKYNIITKLPTINSDNFERFLPAELELETMNNVVNFTKGCYMGQEVIARMHYKAKTKKELVVISSTDDIQALDLRTPEDNPLAYNVNKVFVNGEYFALALFNNKTTEKSYKILSGEVVTIC